MENGDKIPVESPDVLYQRHRTKVLTTDSLTGEVYANGARGRIYLIGDIAPKLNYDNLPASDDRVDFVFADSVVISHTMQVSHAYCSFVVLLHGKRRDIFHSLKRAKGDTLLLQKLLAVPVAQVRFTAMGNIDNNGNYDKHLPIPVVANVAREEAIKLMEALRCLVSKQSNFY
ncbi:MAG: hypothetical protein K0R82_2984 [Flavipsychrobacter sp.]|nr:hypothetical protein [Flavipsychrobacter sp.]